MQNDMRDRLVELIKQAKQNTKNANCDIERNMLFADHLIANGVIVPPCKVGQTVYVVSRYYAGDWEAYKCEIDSITIYEKNTFISCVANDVRFGKINFGLNISEIGKTVFLTIEAKEQAEQKLKEMRVE